MIVEPVGQKESAVLLFAAGEDPGASLSLRLLGLSHLPCPLHTVQSIHPLGPLFMA